MSTTKSTRRNVVVLVCLLGLVTRSVVVSVNNIIGVANSADEAAHHSVQHDKFGANLLSSVQDEKIGSKATRTTKATRCPTKSKAELKDFKKSQFGEDEKLLGYFNGLCGGSYIEMGALDGLQFSNSHVFNKALDWKGLLVELSPSNYEKLVNNRRNEIAVVHAAVCANHQTVTMWLLVISTQQLGVFGSLLLPPFERTGARCVARRTPYYRMFATERSYC